MALRLRGGLCAFLVPLCLAVAPGAGAAGGTFASNDPLLNEIWRDSVRSAADMLAPGPLTTEALGRPCPIDLRTVILDGTVRDRCPYVGDEAVIGLTLDVSQPHWSVQRAMLTWFATHQHPDGAIPASPLVHGQVVLIDYNAYWVLALSNYVLYSGDVALVRQLWPHLLKLLDGWYPAHTRAGLLVNDEGLGDYAFQRRGQLVAYYNAQYSLALARAAQLARWIGEPRASARWLARRRPIARAFTRRFWDAKAGAFVDTTVDRATHPQDAQAFAILAGLARPRQARAALAYLGVHEWRGYGQTVTDTDSWDGPAVGDDVQDRVYPFISYFEVLARYAAGQPEIALQLIRREWGYMAKYGPATNRGTTWETIGPYGGGPVNVHRSWDAGWSSGAAPALTNYVLGVQPASPGYATFTVTPHRGDLAWARGSVVTPHGLLTVSWRRTATGQVRVQVAAPPGTRWIRT
ncbi:MAG TPA: alpha-L-rhamnosidase C-terminal domain-containing protein [Gaiellaceae bacterium]|nr:alpha-L-rhamnosidase C-terminal domain-containing protein [Gaiellaceae bacterium]